MDDEGADWLSEAVSEDVPEPAPAAAAAPAPTEAAAGKAADDTPEVAEELPPEAEGEYLDPDKLLLFKHWIRPKFLQYNYLYNYRRNYYDDVIDYLDKRQRGLSRDVPRAQTWAERALRTYTDKHNREDYYKRSASDIKLVTNSKLSGTFHRYHSKQYVYRRYFSILV
ncbi:hypothetical protein PPYR_10742 [Photinus pyralis]|uniref:Flightin n=1 Tax=Photinus pyralis TaxID=7054 RepID=A0A1Y1LNA6_PHOPY|nr:flightin [Photinus pyralis]KAB0796681.1 hypothetical protein PPYR_10742 [Photinus pyralis]